jgi:hypothetical protein
VTRLEPASFEVERFELGPDACLEIRGRWFGVRGRRFMRPTLTAVADGRERRLLAVLDHKPWIPLEGEAWLAAFPWSADAAALLQPELTVAPDVTVSLPPPSSSGRGRRPRAGRQRSPAREAEVAGEADEPNRRPKDDHGAHDSRLQVEHDAALRSREQALSELDAVKRDRDRLRLELGEALAARETAIAERHDVIQAEVELRIAELRAEAESERAAAGQAAEFARERDTARAERAEAISERDQAHAERDAARRERNRILAQRDTARTRVHEATRRWEATAALATRRTQERDAAASERDRVARERDAALAERDRTIRERDVERDVALAQSEQAASERSRVPVERAVTQLDLEAPRAFSDAAGVAGVQPTESRPAVGTGSAARAPGGSARPSTAISPGTDAARRPRRPPAPDETRPGHHGGRGNESSSTAQAVRRRDEAGMWRARLLAVGALLVALVVFVVTLTAK